MKNLIGNRYGKLVVISISRKRASWGAARWICRCDCGTETTVTINNLGNSTNSCGCIRNTQGSLTQGHPFYRRWKSMIARCEDSKEPAFPLYGGRGISVCERWHNLPNFVADMEPTFFKGATLERVDNEKGYCPENCKWATRKEQSLNRRVNVNIMTPWGRMNQAEAARRIGLDRHVFKARVRMGWTMGQLFDPANRKVLTKWDRRGKH